VAFKVDAFGKLNVLVNNAGISGGIDSDIMSTTAYDSKLRGIKKNYDGFPQGRHPRMFLSGVQPACASRADRSDFRLDSR